MQQNSRVSKKKFDGGRDALSPFSIHGDRLQSMNDIARIPDMKKAEEKMLK